MTEKQKMKQKNTNIKTDSSKLLRDSGLKATMIRVAIIEFLLHNHGPFTTQEIFHELKSDSTLSSIDLVTVYRNMQKFVSVKLVSECVLDDGVSRFEIKSLTHHHHLVCTMCKKIEPMFYCPIKINIPDKIKKGYINLSHKLEFYGVCPNCQRI